MFLIKSNAEDLIPLYRMLETFDISSSTIQKDEIAIFILEDQTTAESIMSVTTLIGGFEWDWDDISEEYHYINFVQRELVGQL